MPGDCCINSTIEQSRLLTIVQSIFLSVWWIVWTLAMDIITEPDRLVIVKGRGAGLLAASAALVGVIILGFIGPAIGDTSYIKGSNFIWWGIIGGPLCLLWMASVNSGRLELDRKLDRASVSTWSSTNSTFDSCALSDIQKVIVETRRSGISKGLAHDRMYFELHDGRKMQASLVKRLPGNWDAAAQACAEFLGAHVKIVRDVWEV